jgi:hypothetical protein
MSVFIRHTPQRVFLAGAAALAIATFGLLGGHPVLAVAAPAGTDGDVVLGANNTTFSTSGLTTTGPNGSGLYASGDYSGVSGWGKTYGVEGNTTSTTGTGVYGFADTGTGVVGNTNSGTGVLAESGGTALQVNGKAVFSGSGVALVPSGSNHVTVTVLATAASMVLATVQGGGSFYVKNAVAGSDSITIYINKAPISPAMVKVAYFVLD